MLDRLTEARLDADRAAELARSLYRLGLADFLTVLDAERRLREVDDQVTVSRDRGPHPTHPATNLSAAAGRLSRPDAPGRGAWVNRND